jgi:hypothetical protein
MRAAARRRSFGLRLALLALATTGFAACNAIFGIEAGQPAGPTGTGGTSSSSTSSTSSSGTTSSSSGTGGAMPAVCDGGAPGADGTNAAFARAYGGMWDEYGYAVAFGKSGTFVVAGTYSDDGTAFHNGPLPYTETYPDGGLAGDDLFVARFQTDGTNLWAQSFRGPGDQGLSSFLGQRNNGLRVALDPNDGIYLAGSFHGSFTMGQTPLADDTSRHDDTIDAFVARLDADGNALWAKRLGGPDNDVVLGLASDQQGNVVLAGMTANIDDTPMNVDFGCGMESIDPQPQGKGVEWLFVSKLDATGACLWHQRFQVDSGFHDIVNIGGGFALALDPSDNVIVGLGAYTDATYIGQGNLGAPHGLDLVLAALDPVQGDVLWSAAYGGDGPQRVWALATDACGDIVVGGEFDQQATFGTLPPLALPPDSGAASDATHAFVLRLARDADPHKPPTPVWAHGFMDDGWQSVTGVAVDNAGKVTVVGNLIDGPASIGVDFGDGNRMAPYPDDAGAYAFHPSFYIAKLEADGKYHFARRFGDDHFNFAYAVAVDGAGHTVVTGSAAMPVDFGGSTTPLSPQNQDAFVVVYGP